MAVRFRGWGLFAKIRVKKYGIHHMLWLPFVGNVFSLVKKTGFRVSHRDLGVQGCRCCALKFQALVGSCFEKLNWKSYVYTRLLAVDEKENF